MSSEVFETINRVPAERIKAIIIRLRAFTKLMIALEGSLIIVLASPLAVNPTPSSALSKPMSVRARAIQHGVIKLFKHVYWSHFINQFNKPFCSIGPFVGFEPENPAPKSNRVRINDWSSHAEMKR